MSDEPNKIEKSKPERFKELMDKAGPLLGASGAAMDKLTVALASAKEVFVELGTLALESITELEEIKGQQADEPLDEPIEPPPVVTIPATPKPSLTPHTKFLETWTAARTCTITQDDSPAAARARIMATGCNLPGSRIYVKGTVPALELGKMTGINGPNGAPLRNVEFRGDGLATIKGVDLANRKDADTGCGEGVALRNLTVRPRHENDGSAILTHKGCASTPTHLVLIDVICNGTEGTAKWRGGSSYQWAILLNEARLTIKNMQAFAGGEHPLYAHSIQGGAYIDGMGVIPQMLYPHGLDQPGFVGGFGRTGAGQFVARGNEGPAAWGDLELYNIKATRCGWEGLTDKIDFETGLLKPGPWYGQGGGSCFTVASHTSGSILMENYEGVDNYCSEFAVWAEAAPGTGFLNVPPTEQNPAGVRSWLVGVDGIPFNPTINGSDADGWAAPEIVLRNWKVTNKGASRKPFLVDSVRRIGFEGCTVNSSPVGQGSGHVQVDQYDWAKPVETVTYK